MDVSDINTINTFLSGTAVAVISYGVTVLHKGIKELNNKVGAQNGRLGKMETWMTGHEKIDDERHKQTQEGIANLWGKLDGE